MRMVTSRSQGASRRLPSRVFSALYSSLAVVAALSGPVELGAQNAAGADRVALEGEVLDGSNNLPVEGVIVSLPGLGLTAVTDSLGYYRMDEVPAATHAVRAIRLGYDELLAYVPVNGAEVLALYMTPSPIPLDGIEVTVVGLEDLDWRAVGTSRQAFIGPGEIEDLRDTYLSLDHVLKARKLPRARYYPPLHPGGDGCLRLVTNMGSRSCAMVVVDGVPIDPAAAGWTYQTSSHDIYSIRFLYGGEAILRFGHRGANGVLLIETHGR